MRSLIFSMTVGEGHNFLARSIAEVFEKVGGVTKTEQVFGYDKRRVERENRLYLWACKRVPHLYDFVWNCARRRNPNKDSKIYFRSLKKCFNHFLNCINDFKPDVIFCTHFYASNILSKMRKENLIDDKIVIASLLTDYCVHPYWEFSRNIDYVFTPFEEVTEELLKKGFKKEQIVPLGLPAREEFSVHEDPKEKRKELNIKENFTVFSIAGGNGLGKTVKLIKNVLKENKNINIICVNGKNEKMKKRVEKFKEKNKLDNIYNFGFVTNIADYMKASDVVICRGGGAAIAEVVNLNKPFIIRENMILNEKQNKIMLIKGGFCLGMKKITEGGKLVRELRENKKLYDEFCQKISSIARPNASGEIVQFLIKKSRP